MNWNHQELRRAAFNKRTFLAIALSFASLLYGCYDSDSPHTGYIDLFLFSAGHGTTSVLVLLYPVIAALPFAYLIFSGMVLANIHPWLNAINLYPLCAYGADVKVYIVYDAVLLCIGIFLFVTGVYYEDFEAQFLGGVVGAYRFGAGGFCGDQPQRL